jgi:hypothetical protein
MEVKQSQMKEAPATPDGPLKYAPHSKQLREVREAAAKQKT